MPVDVAFNFMHGIEGVAQSPPQSNSLNVLPSSTRVMPSGGLHTGMRDLGVDSLWLRASSLWDTQMSQFMTPQSLSPELLLPAVLQARLKRARTRAAKEARKTKSPKLQALVDVLEDDQMLRDMLEQYRNALVKG